MTQINQNQWACYKTEDDTKITEKEKKILSINGLVKDSA